MDSLTQIVLGASMGEMIAGKKLGNRAMVLGGVIATIPDLDVLGGVLGMSPIDALAFHRAISHSLFFAVLAPIVYTLLANRFYRQEKYKLKSVRWQYGTMGILFMLFCAVVVNAIPYFVNQQISIITLLITLGLLVFLAYRLINNYVFNEDQQVENLSWSHWYLFFFIVTVTHPILDCCTAYGTQFFQPFSDLRVSWHNISVADPMYTVPYMLFLILAACYKRSNKIRSWLNYAGIAWGMLYMLFTIKNKLEVNAVFKDALAKKEYTYDRYLTTPTILNNFLWHCIAETDSLYYDGLYSVLSDQDTMRIKTIPKNYHLITLPDDSTFKTLKWFSNGYYNIIPFHGDTLQMNDLRYGQLVGDGVDDPNDYMFRFLLFEENGKYGYQENRDRDGFDSEALRLFWNRIIGVQ